MSFNFDSKKFERELKKSVNQDIQKFFDDFHRRYKGKSVPTIKSALAREWRKKMDGKFSDRQLTEYAEVISQGGKVVVK